MPARKRPSRLAARTVDRRLEALPLWARRGAALLRTATFATFAEAMDAVNRVAAEAERLDHHPDMNISYTKVTFRLSSHDAGGITERDLRLAARIDDLVP